VVCLIDLLRPASWLHEHRIGWTAINGRATDIIRIRLPEFGLDGFAAVLSVAPCPTIKPGPGRVVLMTSRALSDDLITLTLRGTAEGITATSTHPVYSEDRSAFVPVGSLAIGERVRTADGWALVETLTRERGAPRPVCNLEVEEDHTFLVGELGLVSHNDNAVGGGGCGSFAPTGLRDRYIGGSGGRWGSRGTRLFNDQIASRAERSGWTVRGGAGRASEEWIPGPRGGVAGGTWVDLTASKGGRTLRIQTVSTLSDGITPTADEISAAFRIRHAFPNDILWLIPKP